MKITIHCGLHKTATTSFQSLCFENHDCLKKRGIFYPRPDDECFSSIDQKYKVLRKDHHILARSLWHQNFTEVYEMMKCAREECERNEYSCLLSSEDFENLLECPQVAVTFEKILFDAGFTEIDWIFVLRNAWDYFNSLYSELSMYGVSLTYAQMGNAILSRGSYAVQAEFYRLFYCFDYLNYINNFQNNVSGAVKTIKFEDFISVSSEKYFLRFLLGSSDTSAAWHVENVILNKRSELSETEKRYSKNFLGLADKRHLSFWQRNGLSFVMRRKIHEDIENMDRLRGEFMHKFGNQREELCSN